MHEYSIIKTVWGREGDKSESILVYLGKFDVQLVCVRVCFSSLEIAKCELHSNLSFRVH